MWRKIRIQVPNHNSYLSRAYFFLVTFSDMSAILTSNQKSGAQSKFIFRLSIFLSS